VLPVSVDRIAPLAPLPAPHVRVVARERHAENGLFVYDLSAFDDSGTVREHWSGLHLRTVEPLPNPVAWNVALLGPYLERRLRELCRSARLSVLLEQGGGIDDRPARGDQVIRRLLGSNGPVFRRPDGKPEIVGPDAPDVSVSYAGDLVLAVAGPAPVGCDIETVSVSSGDLEWESLLGPLFELSAVLQELPHECRETAFARVWTARECLRKAGLAADAPLVVDAEDGGGWIVLRSGSVVIGTFVAQITGADAPFALALLTRSEM
jgi:enediyne polyketide synthase